MKHSKLLTYLLVREYCALREAKLNEQTMELCKTNNLDGEMKKQDWILHRMYVSEMRRENYQLATDVIDRKTDISIQDVLRIERFFEVESRKNKVLLNFYRQYREGLQSDMLNADEEIRILETDERFIRMIIDCCEERIFGGTEEQEAVGNDPL